MTPLYQLNHVKFAYSDKPVLDIKQLEIIASAVTALLGNNGSGKSTLLKLLAFLERPQQGVIRFNNENLTNSSLLALRRRVVLVAQKPYLLRGTVIKNVLMGLKFRGISNQLAKKSATEALQKTGILALADRDVEGLSGGETQKVALARAWALEPEVLLLDEPFTYLDQTSIEQLSHLIKNLFVKEGQSIIFTTHNKILATSLADETINLVKI